MNLPLLTSAEVHVVQAVLISFGVTLLACITAFKVRKLLGVAARKRRAIKHAVAHEQFRQERVYRDWTGQGRAG